MSAPELRRKAAALAEGAATAREQAALVAELLETLAEAAEAIHSLITEPDSPSGIRRSGTG